MKDKIKDIAKWAGLLTILTWWSGVGGSAAFGIPGLVFLGFAVALIAQKRFAETVEYTVGNLLEWCGRESSKKWVLGFFLLNGGVWFSYIIIKYYSFQLFTFDSGIWSNIFYNISNGEAYSSFLNMHSWGDHFVPSVSFVSLFYMIVPSIHWMMGFKILGYLLCPFLIYALCKEVLKDDPRLAKNYALILSLLWLFFYTPIVSSIRYEFQASSIGLPLVFYAALCMLKKQWVRFFLCLLILAGVKEHLSHVAMGFGCYLVLARPEKKRGVLLIIGGVLALYLVMFQIMPYFRELGTEWGEGHFDPLGNGVSRVAPFKDIPDKLYYGLRLLWPLAFIPLLFWRNGILAGPGLGINLISGVPNMYSSHYHYDDVPSAMLFIAIILSLPQLKLKERFQKIKKNRIMQSLLLIWIVCFLALLPNSNLRFLKKAIPTEEHWEILQEVEKVDQMTQGQWIAVQDVLGPHFYRKTIRAVEQRDGKSCEENPYRPEQSVDYIVLARALNLYNVRDIDRCIQELENIPHFKKIEGFQHLLVFQNQKTQ